MKNYDAKDAWLVVDGKKVMNLNINDEQFYGWGDVDWHLPKDNSKENQDRLRDNFKYAQSEPIPSKRKVILYNFEYVQIPDKDFSRHGKMHFISIDDKEAINLTEVLHIKACKIAELRPIKENKQ